MGRKALGGLDVFFYLLDRVLWTKAFIVHQAIPEIVTELPKVASHVRYRNSVLIVASREKQEIQLSEAGSKAAIQSLCWAGNHQEANPSLENRLASSFFRYRNNTKITECVCFNLPRKQSESKGPSRQRLDMQVTAFRQSIRGKS